MTKKVGERIYLESFLKAEGWWDRVEGVIERENPDFVVQFRGAEPLGVEVTHLFADAGKSGKGGSRLREEESFGARWLRDLAAQYYATDGVPLQVNVLLRYTHPNRTAELSDELSGEVLRVLREAGARLRAEESEEIELLGPRETPLAKVFAYRLRDSERGYSRGWKVLNHRVGWVKTMSGNEVQKIVNEKANRLDDYHRAVPRIALLIVANKFLRSGLLRFDGAVIDGRGFESVYLLHYPERKVEKLA